MRRGWRGVPGEARRRRSGAQVRSDHESGRDEEARDHDEMQGTPRLRRSTTPRGVAAEPAAPVVRPCLEDRHETAQVQRPAPMSVEFTRIRHKTIAVRAQKDGEFLPAAQPSSCSARSPSAASPSGPSAGTPEALLDPGGDVATTPISMPARSLASGKPVAASAPGRRGRRALGSAPSNPTGLPHPRARLPLRHDRAAERPRHHPGRRRLRPPPPPEPFERTTCSSPRSSPPAPPCASTTPAATPASAAPP